MPHLFLNVGHGFSPWALLITHTVDHEPVLVQRG
jgi:hypothetical protein